MFILFKIIITLYHINSSEAADSDDYITQRNKLTIFVKNVDINLPTNYFIFPDYEKHPFKYREMEIRSSLTCDSGCYGFAGFIPNLSETSELNVEFSKHEKPNYLDLRVVAEQYKGSSFNPDGSICNTSRPEYPSLGTIAINKLNDHPHLVKTKENHYFLYLNIYFPKPDENKLKIISEGFSIENPSPFRRYG